MVPEALLFSDPNKLLLATQKYFESIQTSSIKRLDFSDIPVDCTVKQLFEHLLKKYEGICIGESHTHSSPKYILSYFMPLFVALGVDTLYIEGYGYQSHQKYFDAYFRPETKPENIPYDLEVRMIGMEGMLEGVPGYTERDVIIAAKKAGIRRVICIDTTASNQIHPKFIGAKGKEVHGIARVAVMNFQAKCIIDHTMGEKGGKCLIWAGSAHTSRCGGVPSLEQLCGFPSVSVCDTEGVGRVIAENAKVDPSSCSVILREASQDYAGRTIESDFEITMLSPLKRAIFPSL